jgi:pimeloyl-ACP methyl ester carboxylesterase
VFYEEHTGGDEVIVWLHGYGCSTEQWERIVPHVGSYHSYVFDLPGHGESVDVDCDGTIPSFTAPIVRAIEELGLERFTVVGYSLGAQIAMRIAVDHPDRVERLVGVVPWYAAGGDPDDATLDSFADAWGQRDLVRESIERLAVVQPPYYGQLLEDELKVPEHIWRGWFTHGGKISYADELPNVGIPVTYILGIEDVVVDVHKVMADIKAIPNARAVALSGVGHLCAWEMPDVVVRELTLVLDARDTGATTAPSVGSA